MIPAALIGLRLAGIPRALILMVGMFHAGAGVLLVSWGIRHCVHEAGGGGSFQRETYTYSVCFQWDSSPLIVLTGAIALAGGGLALLGFMQRFRARRQGLLLGAGVLLLASFPLAVSPIGLPIFLLSPVILWVIGVRLLRSRARTT